LITVSVLTTPKIGPTITPATMRKATSGIPVLLKNASPKTPRKMMIPTARRITSAEARWTL